MWGAEKESGQGNRILRQGGRRQSRAGVSGVKRGEALRRQKQVSSDVREKTHKTKTSIVQPDVCRSCHLLLGNISDEIIKGKGVFFSSNCLPMFSLLA